MRPARWVITGHASHRARITHGVMHAEPERRSQSWSQVAPRRAVLEPVSDRHARSTHVKAEEMCGAYPLDPPLAVDIGVGDDWNEAKG